MSDLRSRLTEITSNGLPNSHPRLIDQLQLDHVHGIEFVSFPVAIERYTCAMHAFDLVEDEEYAGLVLASPAPVYASTGFVQRLIDRGVLERLAQPQSSALVVYRLGRTVKHIGRTLSPERCESKWGIGHLYRHGLLEVPSDYGDCLEFYRAIDRDSALDELVIFAREHGVQFVGDA